LGSIGIGQDFLHGHPVFVKDYLFTHSRRC